MGRTRKGEHDGQVPAAQALPGWPGPRRGLRADGPVDAGRGRRAHAVHARLRGPAGGDGRVRRHPGADARRRVRAVRRRGAATGDRRAVRRDQGPDRRVVHHRRGVVGPRGTSWRGSCRRLPGPAASRSTNGWRFGRFWPTRPRPPSERVAAAGPRARGDRCPRPARGRLRVGRGRRAGRPGRGRARVAG